MVSRRVGAVLSVLALATVLVVDGDVTGRDAKGPTGLGPELDRLFERCWADPASEDTCYEIEDFAEAASRPVAGAQGAADELCRQLIPVDASRLAGLRAHWVTRELRGDALMCSSPTRLLSIIVMRGTDPLRCKDGDATRQCTELADGSRVKDLTRPGDAYYAQIVRRWDNADALMVTVGPDPPGQREPDRADVVEALAAATAVAFDLGR